MEPRHYAVDKDVAPIETWPEQDEASMEPRHYAVDKPAAGPHTPRQPDVASMEPRHYAVDKVRNARYGIRQGFASMEPRHYAVDKDALRDEGGADRGRFNGATALRRG